MMRHAIVGTVVLILVTTPASAQFAVIDPANLAHAILIVQRTQRHLEELQAQYRTIVRMAQGLGRMDQYRIPPFALTGHDAGQWTYGSRWIAALNSGDATGAAYLATATPLAPPNAPARLTAAAPSSSSGEAPRTNGTGGGQRRGGAGGVPAVAPRAARRS